MLSTLKVYLYRESAKKIPYQALFILIKDVPIPLPLDIKQE